MTHPCSRLAGLCAAVLSLFLVNAARAAEQIDTTPRLAIISAFAPELEALLAQTKVERTAKANGVEFSIGTLAGKPVLVLASGVSMVNAAMTTQLTLDRFNVSAIIVDGIAGGVDPSLAIGDVVVPDRWGQYLEAIFARETDTGFAPPPWAEKPFANFGMIHPQAVGVRSAATDQPASKFWFDADPDLLKVAQGIVDKAELKQCESSGACLDAAPRVVVGGQGVSGQAFVDNAKFREFVFATFKAQVLDMETAAVATVAYANGVPFIGFRSLSDLAGGGPGANEMETFFHLASANAASVLVAFVKALPADMP